LKITKEVLKASKLFTQLSSEWKQLSTILIWSTFIDTFGMLSHRVLVDENAVDAFTRIETAQSDVRGGVANLFSNQN
jgi:hypothetical protein